MTTGVVIAIATMTFVAGIAVASIWQRMRVVLVIGGPRQPPRLPPAE